MSSQLPDEIVDSIVDNNHDDRLALLYSALVSGQWLHASRYHTFTEVRITADNAQTFLDLLTSPFCTFKTTLRSLNIKLVPGSQRWFYQFSATLLSSNDIDIKTLRLFGSSNTTIRDETLSAMVYYSGHVTTFDVGALVFNSFSQYAQILYNFTALKSLSCAATFRTGPSIPHDLRLVCPLQSLQLTSPCIQPMLEFLEDHGSFLALSSLSLVHLSQDDISILTRVLRTLRDNIKTFTIKLDGLFSGVDVATFTHALDLSHLGTLRHLGLDITPKLSPDQAYTVLASTAPESRLESLNLSLALEQGVARIDVFLCSDVRFAHLQRVVVLSTAWSDVRQFLPRCDARNILRHAN